MSAIIIKFLNTQEIFSALVRGSLYPSAQIDISIEILQSDGSEFSTAINAASLALVVAGIEMIDLPVASTVGRFLLSHPVALYFALRYPSYLATGFYGSRLFADLCRYEENSRVTRVTIVCLPGNSETNGRPPAGGSSLPAQDAIASHSLIGARLLHTRLSSWLPSERLVSLVRGGVGVAKVIHAELTENLKRHVKFSERV